MRVRALTLCALVSNALLLAALLAGNACWLVASPAQAAEPPPAVPSKTQSQSSAEPRKAKAISGPSDGEFSKQLLSHQVKAPDNQQTGQKLNQILAKPEYSGESEPKQRKPTWLSRLLEQLGHLFERMGIANSGPVSVAVISLLILLLVYAVVRLVWGVLAKQRARQAAPGEDGSERVPSEDELLLQAQRALASGQYREAMRWRYLALLKRLDVPTVALQTNWQLVRRVVRDWPQAAAPFKSLVLCFEDAWYGSLPCGSEDYRQADELASAVQQVLVSQEVTP